MAVWTEETMNPSPIENTTVVKRFSDGVHKTYRIAPNEGYVLHDNMLDEIIYDPETDDIIGYNPKYYSGFRSVAASYDFTVNPRDFYAVLSSSVSEDDIYGVVNPPVIA